MKRAPLPLVGLCLGPVLWLLLATTAWAGGLDVAVRHDAGQLLVDVSVEGLFDEKVERALRSGLPARVELRVELWSRRTAFWDRLVAELEIESRVVFDLLDERYDVIDESGDRVLSTESLDRVREWLSRIEDLPLYSLDELDPGRRHYVAVEIRLQPLTAEEVRELQRWLSGNLQRDDSALDRWTSQFLGVIRERIGLGRRDWKGRSTAFRPRELRRAERG